MPKRGPVNGDEYDNNYNQQPYRSFDYRRKWPPREEANFIEETFHYRFVYHFELKKDHENGKGLIYINLEQYKPWKFRIVVVTEDFDGVEQVDRHREIMSVVWK